jgi:ribonuclease HI
VSFEWIPREINTRADRLANLAMDRRADLDDR